VWASPPPAISGFTSSGTDTQSITGKISSIGDAAFTLDVAKNQGSNASTLQFLVDGKTKVDGKLTVGAKATVEYRNEHGTYIATHVVVTPASSRPH